MSAATVLVVDDDPVILQLLKLNFELEGYRVLTAADGPSALAQLAVEPAPAADAVDAVVLDVMMPGMSGLEVAARIQNDVSRPRPGVLLLSAKAQAADVDAGLAVADDYVTKPFDAVDLVQRVAAVIGAGRAATRTEAD